MGVTLLSPSCAAQVGLSLDWTSSSRSLGDRSYRWYPKEPGKSVCSCGRFEIMPRTFHGFRMFLLLNLNARVKWPSDWALV